MINYKTQKEIEVIAFGGKILANILQQIVAKIQTGVGTKELNNLAELLIKQAGGRPSFKGFEIGNKIFPSALCTSINDEVVHAPAEPDRILKEGDIIGLDIGMEYQGGFTDMAVTIGVGEISEQAKKLLQVTKASLNLAIDNFKEGNTLYDLAKAIQEHVEKNGFSVVKELVGHGVGKDVHEDPKVPNYMTEEAKHIKIKRGLVIAVEPMVCVGGWKIKTLSDGFTFASADGSLSAQFEHTMALDHEGKVRVLTMI